MVDIRKMLAMRSRTTAQISNFVLQSKRVLSTTSSYSPMKLKPLPVSGNMTKVVCTLGPSTCDQEKISACKYIS